MLQKCSIITKTSNLACFYHVHGGFDGLSA